MYLHGCACAFQAPKWQTAFIDLTTSTSCAVGIKGEVKCHTPDPSIFKTEQQMTNSKLVSVVKRSTPVKYQYGINFIPMLSLVIHVINPSSAVS